MFLRKGIKSQMVKGRKQNINPMIIQYITENQSKFYHFVYYYIHDRKAAMDIVYLSIIKAIRKYGKTADKDAFQIMLYRILVRKSIKYMEKYRLKNSYLSEDLEEILELPDNIQKEEGYELFQKINYLSWEEKLIIMLRYYQNFRLEEIAAITDLNRSTIKFRLYKGLNQLKVVIQEEQL